MDQLRTSELAKKDGAIVPCVTYEEEDIDSEFEQVTLDYPNHILPLSKTTMGQVASKSVRDWSLFKGCSFRVGWSIGNSFVFLTTQNSAFGDFTSDIMNLDKYIGGRSKNDLSSCVVQRLQLCGGVSKSLNKLSVRKFFIYNLTINSIKKLFNTVINFISMFFLSFENISSHNFMYL